MGQCSSKKGMGEKGSSSSSMERRGGGCLAMVQERRSRFYIARKCIFMLLCWHRYHPHH
ncbi:PREDICTED: uncharacterized protein LOC109116896 [Tarenaya hassleriana]|uniref:uncharacterized protein LOC109116896 n=1 Tax=Tarenaya hassleriana TaxID=28532 RepID=UPI0008FD6226|nr:PREDICTED: uncharacterized protein LOC109116896 [Tarenaya hassleriana]